MSLADAFLRVSQLVQLLLLPDRFEPEKFPLCLADLVLAFFNDGFEILDL